MRGTLHFCDDPTHKRLYNILDVCNILLENGFVILKAGKRRNIWGIIVLPIRLLIHMLIKKPIEGSIFWDLLGFAEFICAKRIKE